MPNYREPAPYRQSYAVPGNSIAQLILNQGNIAAESAGRSGDIWGNAIYGIGQQLGGALQERAAKKEEDKRKNALNAQDTAFLTRIADTNQPPITPAETLRIYGMERGPAIFRAYASLQSDKPDLKTILAGHRASSPQMRATAWPKERELLRNAGLAEEHLPVEYDDAWFERFDKEMSGQKPKGLTEVSAGASLYDEEKREAVFTAPKPDAPASFEHVETDAGIQPFDPRTGTLGSVIGKGKPAAVPKPTLERVETVGPDGKPITQFIEPKAGSTYARPDKPVPQQRLTKDERQDFAAWNYSLPRLESFAQYVQDNPDKWGKWDAFVQGVKQNIPGFTDADYASEEAFIARMNSEIRHALFGAALTGGEQESAKAFLINRGDQPVTVMAKLTEAVNRGRSGIDYYKQLGFNIPAAPPPGSSTQAPSAAKRVTRAEYDQLSVGATYIAPDGSTRTKK